MVSEMCIMFLFVCLSSFAFLSKSFHRGYLKIKAQSNFPRIAELSIRCSTGLKVRKRAVQEVPLPTFSLLCGNLCRLATPTAFKVAEMITFHCSMNNSSHPSAVLGIQYSIVYSSSNAVSM